MRHIIFLKKVKDKDKRKTIGIKRQKNKRDKIEKKLKKEIQKMKG